MNIRHKCKHSFLVSVGLAMVASGCVKDPSKDAMPAEVKPVKPSGENAEIVKPLEGKVVEKSAQKSAEQKILELTGDIVFIGSKVSGAHECKFKDWSGKFILPQSQNLDEASIEFTVRTESVVADYKDPSPWSGKLEKHLRSDDFFDSETHPEAKFKSTSILSKIDEKTGSTHEVKGMMTIRGIAKELTFPASIKQNEGKIIAGAEFSINRKQFDIVYPGKSDDLIREGVVIRLSFASK
ncbi:MAG: YceI family protein [Myxococcota bacterium]|nr:YceI family protein [Myxococcota bacterium]